MSKSRTALLFLSGSLLGLALFTKPEIALAAIASSALLFLAHFHWGRGWPARDGGAETKPPSVSPVWSFVCGTLAAISVVLLPLSLALHSFSRAFHSALLNLYLSCFNSTLSSISFYKGVLGTDDIPAHTLRLLFGALLAILPVLCARFALHRLSSLPFRFAATALLVSASAALAFFAFNPLNAALPLAPLVFALLSFRNRGRPARSPLALAFASFSLLLVSKMILNAHIWHYGFVLSLPAFCCAVLLLFRFPFPSARAAIAMALLFGFTAKAVSGQHRILRLWNIAHPVHDQAFRTDPANADAFTSALDWLRANTAPSSSLAVLPEGAILNVLSGRSNPTPYVYLTQGDWLRFGESSILAAYSNSPPDTLVLVRKPEIPAFGAGYAQSLMAFLDPLYTPVLTITSPTPSGPLPYLLVATRTSSPP